MRNGYYIEAERRPDGWTGRLEVRVAGMRYGGTFEAADRRVMAEVGVTAAVYLSYVLTGDGRLPPDERPDQLTDFDREATWEVICALDPRARQDDLPDDNPYALARATVPGAA